MAGSLTARSTATDTSHQIRFVDKLFEYLGFEEVPFLKAIGIDGSEVDNPKVEWFEDDLLSESSALNGALADTVGTAVVVTTGDAHKFQVGSVILIDSEQMWVSAISSDTLTVTRGAFGSTAATHSNAAAITIVGISIGENVDAPAKGTTSLVNPYNRCQIFNQQYQISHRQQHTASYVIKNDEDYQLEKAFKELMNKLERTAFLGRRADAAGSVPATMGGIDWFLNATNSTQLPSAHVVDHSAAALTEKVVVDLLQTIFGAVGGSHMAKLLVCGPWVKRKLNSFWDGEGRHNASGKRVTMPLGGATASGVTGPLVEAFATDFGTVRTLLCQRCPAGTLYLINPEFVKMHPYAGSKFYDEELAKSGAYTKKQVYGDYTMVVRNIKTMGKIHNISTSA